ncbi:MAG: cytidine deaminase [Pyrinomonadaceae bacterium]|nr:cytidine deaminase [Pyrinomonadaceae bacterium]
MSSETAKAKLISAAGEAREKAHVPFSKFKVGAALETSSGEIITGCNIENASYGLTLCAERVAIFKAISEGKRDFAAIAVVVDTDELTPPCGACRQIIWEFCGDIPITMANLKGRVETIRMSELLPRAFDAGFLTST